MSIQPITVITYNMHKGMSALNRQVQINNMANALKSIESDIVFLQEVQGENLKRQFNIKAFPFRPHYNILSEALEFNSSYGQNAEYREKHHGNSILSHFNITTHRNVNISTNKLEQRGMLHCEIHPPGWPFPIICLCAHLNLREPDRIRQYQMIRDYIAWKIPPEYPLILAGDFNDWRLRSQESLGDLLGLQDAFFTKHHHYPATFPSRFPLLSLDRLYTRGLEIVDATVHQDSLWPSLSDHLPISAKLLPSVTALL